jgi:uncharacterized protein YqhQ
MAKQNLQELTAEELQKKEKLLLRARGAMFGIAGVFIGLILFAMYKKLNLTTSLICSIALLPGFISVSTGLKAVREELAKR